MVDIIIPNAGYESKPTTEMLTSDDISLGRGLGATNRVEIDENTVSPVQNQYLDKLYAACGAYSASHSTNAMNAEEGTFGLSPESTSTGIDFWKIQKNEYRGDDRYGSYQIDNINMLQKYGYIAGYYWCKNQQAVDEAIDAGFAISTGSREIDWEATRKNNNVAVRGAGSAHLFTILGKDYVRKCYIVRDSAGTEHWDNGRFYVPFDMFDTLYSCYALIDKSNQHILDQATADKASLDTAIRLGFTNGLYLDAYAERWMAAIMFARIAKYPITGIDDDHLKEYAKEIGVWNGSDENRFVTRYEVALMAAGVLGIRSSSDMESIQKIIALDIMKSAEEIPILREHLIYVIMRVFDKKA